MSIPSVPRAQIAEKDGTLNTEWRIYFDQLSFVLQSSFPFSGYKMPSKDNSEISNLVNEDLAGGFIYNREQKNMQVNTEEAYKPVSTYEELSTSEINDIPSGERNGRFIYDTDETSLKVGFNDSFLTVTTT
ncbi:hypothetical protein [uncultured Paraglaciecola sp.]|uniref:hypothetical protein n=1 Tax=uncultured Paraglaciecola sp. TaxID=1765024 RepID=UPI00260E28FC|nr:hypothetical protein [uncultured Paraglaciecola sp.]